MPFGSFMDAVGHPVFLILHGALALLGVSLWRMSRTAGSPVLARGFLLYIVAELAYISYHLDFTTLHFAHAFAEVCDALAFLTLGLGIRPRAA
jgi:hypothetical protein